MREEIYEEIVYSKKEKEFTSFVTEYKKENLKEIYYSDNKLITGSCASRPWTFIPESRPLEPPEEEIPIAYIPPPAVSEKPIKPERKAVKSPIKKRSAQIKTPETNVPTVDVMATVTKEYKQAPTQTIQDAPVSGVKIQKPEPIEQPKIESATIPQITELKPTTITSPIIARNEEPKQTVKKSVDQVAEIPKVIADTSKINPDLIKSKVASILGKIEKKPSVDFNDPQAIFEYLSQWVTGQEPSKKALALAFSDYLSSGTVNPVLLLGPSGSGKTYSAGLVCDAAGIPWVKISCANVTTEGYKGRNLTEGLEGLVGKDRGVIFFDEFDKLVSGDTNNPGFGPKLQRELLAIFTGEKIKLSGMSKSSDQMEKDEDEKEEASFSGIVALYYLKRNKASDRIREELDSRSIIYEEIEMESLSSQSESDAKVIDLSKKGKEPVVRIDGKLVNGSNIDDVLEGLGIKKNKNGKSKKRSQSSNFIDTSKYLILCAGAFAGEFNKPALQEIIQGRLGGNTCKMKKEQVLEQMTDEDLVNYGLMPELVGRIKTKTILYPHDAEGLLKILKENKGSPYTLLVQRFKDFGIELSIEEDGLKRVAELALAGVGVRALGSVLEKIVEKYSFERKKYVGKKIIITKGEIDKEFKKEAEFAEVDNFKVDWQNPNSIIEYMNIYMPGQEEAKKALAKSFYLYSTRLKSKTPQKVPQANMMILGPTGCGKTFGVELLAKKAKMPIIKVNFGNMNDTLEKALSTFPKGKEKGIIYVDEADKVLMNPADPRNKSFIGYLENGVYNGIDLSGMLFILSGAFQPLYDSKGYGAMTPEERAKLRITRTDLEKFGVPKEILGRLPILANIMPMTQETLVSILKSPKSAVNDYLKFFKDEQNVQIELEEGAYQIMADEALKTSQGARALKSVCDKLFDWYIFNAEPGQKYSIDKQKAEEVLRGEK
ncbi:AAA family ATPase [archaeon]|nr:AAA family ATPase [archaeon]